MAKNEVEKESGSEQTIEVKFLKNGYPWGFAYHKDERAKIAISKEQYDRLVEYNVITKV